MRHCTVLLRPLLMLLFLLAGFHTLAGSGLRINELQASNPGTIELGDGDTPDWIELYNPQGQPIDLRGMRLVVNGRQHHFEQSLTVPAKGHRLLWCGAKQGGGADHLGFSLPRSGGTILLVHTNGTTILDLFTWPALGAGTSIGRMPDGATTWGYLECPTPGAPNPDKATITQRTATPLPVTRHTQDGTLEVGFGTTPDTRILFTLDGRAANSEHANIYSGAVSVPRGAVLRYSALAMNGLAAAENSLIVPREGHSGAYLSLAIDPASLWDDSTGIAVPGAFSNHTRTGMEWEREALVQFANEDSSSTFPAGVRISGSGSRGAAKRSFKLYTRGRYDSPDAGITFADGSRFDQGMLRADASPNAFLRNRFFELLVEQHGLALDVQSSTPVPLYLNGSYWGLYRWMPPKNAAWARQVSGEEAVDLLAGPAALPLSGSGEHFREAQNALFDAAPMADIESSIDLTSLIDLACIDLWTGRADHELNVRCYRPRRAGGKWRWILYDMDLWSTPEENSLERMCSAQTPETPYLPQLMSHPELQLRTLARMSALLATALEPTHARALADSLFLAHKEELLADHRRWAAELAQAPPEERIAEITRFIVDRPEHLVRHITEHSGRKARTVRIEVPPHDQGLIYLEGLLLAPGKVDVHCFTGVPMKLTAVPGEHQEFVEWKGLDQGEQSISEDFSQAKVVRPLFRPVVP
jgi:hypothetical protein